MENTEFKSLTELKKTYNCETKEEIRKILTSEGKTVSYSGKHKGFFINT